MHYKFAHTKNERIRFNTLYISENTGNIIISIKSISKSRNIILKKYSV